MFSFAFHSMYGYFLIVPVLIMYKGAVDSNTFLLSGANGLLHTFFFYKAVLKNKDINNCDGFYVLSIFYKNLTSEVINSALILIFFASFELILYYFKSFVYENNFPLSAIWVFLCVISSFLGCKLMCYLEEKETQRLEEYYAS